MITPWVGEHCGLENIPWWRTPRVGEYLSWRTPRIREHPELENILRWRTSPCWRTSFTDCLNILWLHDYMSTIHSTVYTDIWKSREKIELSWLTLIPLRSTLFCFSCGHFTGTFYPQACGVSICQPKCHQSLPPPLLTGWLLLLTPS